MFLRPNSKFKFSDNTIFQFVGTAQHNGGSLVHKIFRYCVLQNIQVSICKKNRQQWKPILVENLILLRRNLKDGVRVLEG